MGCEFLSNYSNRTQTSQRTKVVHINRMRHSILWEGECTLARIVEWGTSKHWTLFRLNQKNHCFRYPNSGPTSRGFNWRTSSRKSYPQLDSWVLLVQLVKLEDKLPVWWAHVTWKTCISYIFWIDPLLCRSLVPLSCFLPLAKNYTWGQKMFPKHYF